jgi:hypothetical protein
MKDVGCLLLPFWVIFAAAGVWCVVTAFGEIFFSPDMSRIGGSIGKILAGIFLIGIPMSLLVAVRRTAWLNKYGRRVQADFVRVLIRRCDSGDSRVYDTYHVICRWVNPETNQTYLFSSADCGDDPTAWLSGKTVDVVLDPSNPKHYRVDLSSLPPNAGRVS